MANIPTCNVLCTIRDNDGTPISGAIVTAKLDRYEVYEGYVVPDLISGTTDANGQCVLVLWPNELGSTESSYDIKIVAPNGKSLRTTATVPNVSDANLHEVANLPPYEGKSDGQLIIDAAVAAAAPAVAAQLAAESAAATATTQAGVATTKAGEAEGSATSAAGHATTAQGYANTASGQAGIATTQAAIATTQAGNASTSASQAASSASAAGTSASSAAASASTALTNAGEAETAATAAAASQTAAVNAKNTAVEHSALAINAANTATSASTTASTQAAQAQVSATAATASATSANDAKTVAQTAASNAASSASAASTSASNASTSAGQSATSASNAASSAATATSRANEALVSATNAANSAATATTQAGVATTQAGIATTKAGESAASAVTAATQAGLAATSATAANAAKVSAEAARDTAVAVVTGGTASAEAAPGKIPIADGSGRLLQSWATALGLASLLLPATSLANGYVIARGNLAMTPGTLDIASGVTVTVEADAQWVITGDGRSLLQFDAATGGWASVPGTTGKAVGDSDTQTLTHKTLETPVINDPVIDGGRITNCEIILPAAIWHSHTITGPVSIPENCNAVSIPPISILSGGVVSVGVNSTWSFLNI